MNFRVLSNAADSFVGGLKKMKINHAAQKELNQLAKSGAEGVEDAAKEVAEKASKEIADITEDVSKRKAVRNSLKEATSSSGNSDVVDKAIKKQKPGKLETPSNSYEYRQRIEDGNEIFEKRATGTENWITTDNQDYAIARRGAHSKENQFTYSTTGSSDSLPSVIAENTSKTKAGEHAGIDFESFSDFVGNHPGWAMGGAIASGAVVGQILDDD